MTTANVVDVSEYQPTTIDFEDLKKQGIKAVIVRLGHGTTQDKNAASHIARATTAGLIVHGYHFYEGIDGEVAWSLKNAQDLGLATSAYYFLDMEGDIAGSWPDIFRSFYRNWLQAGYHVGLYCSLSKYSLFDDKEMTTNDIYRWIADWDVDAAPSVADVWQYNCSTGLGLYQDKLDKDVDIAGKLVETIEPTSHVTNPDEDYEVTAGAFVGFDYSTTAVTGGKFLVASPDGKNKIPKLSPDGHFFFNKTDGDNMWALIKPHTNEPVSWNDVTDKPDLDSLKTSSLPWSAITDKPDLSQYATKDDLDKVKSIKGDPGVPGKDGKSAYQIAVDHGFVGSEAEWLQSLHGKDGTSTSGGDESLSIEAITDLVKQHIHAGVNVQTGQLTISTDDTDNSSIADAVAAKVVASMNWKLDDQGELIAQLGGE